MHLPLPPRAGKSLSRCCGRTEIASNCKTWHQPSLTRVRTEGLPRRDYEDGFRVDPAGDRASDTRRGVHANPDAGRCREARITSILREPTELSAEGVESPPNWGYRGHPSLPGCSDSGFPVRRHHRRRGDKGPGRRINYMCPRRLGIRFDHATPTGTNPLTTIISASRITLQ